jgi:hypothetical protein
MTEFKEKLAALACALSEFEFTEETPVSRLAELRTALASVFLSGGFGISITRERVNVCVDGMPLSNGEFIADTVSEALNAAVREVACELTSQVLGGASVSVGKDADGYWVGRAAQFTSERYSTGHDGESWGMALREAALLALASK